MKTRLLFWFVLVVALPIQAQYQEMMLPEALVVTGISLNSDNEGLVTTQDSTVYRISFKENQVPQIREVVINDRYAPHFKYSNPFWVNDSTFGLVRTFWDDWACGGHHLLLTHDFGRTFRAVYEMNDHFNIRKIQVHSDSVLFFSVTSDIANSIELIRCVHYPGTSDYKSYYFLGHIYPEFTLIDDEKILISSMTDSVYYFYPALDSFAAVKTNLEKPENYDFFRCLEKGGDGEIIAARTNGLFRSTDDGINWHLVLPSENFRRIREEGNGRWWAMSYGNTENRLWQSVDNGVSWTPLFSVGNYWMLMDVAFPNWFWLVNYGVPGKILYGQYDPLAISGNQISPAEAFRLLPAYPNPFNSTTTIVYDLDRPGLVEIGIFNIRGQLVRQLIREKQSSGRHQLKWDGTDATDFPVTTGLYLVKSVFEGSRVATKKTLLLK